MKALFKALPVLFLLLAAPLLHALDHPTIRSIELQRTNLLVRAEIPAGIRKVTLESRARFGSGTWTPRAVLRLDGSGGSTVFNLPRSTQQELLRIRADAVEALPTSFYTGTNTFLGPTNTSNTAAPPGVDGSFTGVGGGLTRGEESREVVESDIWKISGNTLYFFNQYRGLQVIDITQPDNAQIRSQIHLPFAGEDLYLLNSNRLVLLARDNCSWSPTGPESKIIIVDVSSSTPVVLTNLPFNGYLVESRLVGTALYIAAQSYRVTTNTSGGTSIENWEAGVQVTSFDLSNPLAPRQRSTFWFPGYGGVVSATDRYLFVSSVEPSNYYVSNIRVLDISAADGTVRSLSTIRAAGSISDKFKINLNGNVLTLISANWNDTRRWVTKLETFSLNNPNAPVKLGTLTLAEGEQLHGTRFDGNLVYIVTYFRIDPLWVVDLSNPSQPRIAGELQVPGWSTYLHPLGDRLLTVGIDDTNGFRVAVSLFNVANPSNPLLLSRVSLGENYSWSEANVDEKAFQVLPSHGLVMVPYQGYWSNNYASRVQLIDLGRDSLQARGVIDHEMQPRRATVFSNRILSLSATELLSVDATDRDHPEVKGSLELAWSVNRLILSGDYLLEVSAGNNWSGIEKPTIRIAAKTDPETILQSFRLNHELPVSSIEQRGDKIYVAQNQSYVWWQVPGGNSVPETNLYLSVFDASALPNLTLLGSTGIAVTNLGWNNSWKMLFPNDRTAVLSGGGNSWGPWLDVGLGMGRPVSGIGIWWPSWGNEGGRLIAFDVQQPAAPRFASEVKVGTNSWYFGPALVSGGNVFTSHQTYHEIILPAQGTNPPVHTWSSMWFLDVVDYADPREPVARSEVNIPGRLEGLSHEGSLLYTVGSRWRRDLAYDGTEYLEASAYDGVEAHLVDSLSLTNWPHPIALKDAFVILGRGGNEGTNGTLEVWQISSVGKFANLNRTSVNSPISTLKLFGDLLAAQTYADLKLFDASNLPSVPLLKSTQPDACNWYWLENAIGSLADGIFIPQGFSGVQHVPIQ